ncbi:hypothetical protein SASPL_129012 [Salvia splendens]|uniref:Late embryogenesis abundant protein LEA-2 subgroup domain-containing protein n=1 Tax=Salvia splendens TaxID=180675 RepID=A0A8X8ZP21_SALSN|nr:hypothetical protein SASPL_129012 [Salvia splendens]
MGVAMHVKSDSEVTSLDAAAFPSAAPVLRAEPFPLSPRPREDILRLQPLRLPRPPPLPLPLPLLPYPPLPRVLHLPLLRLPQEPPPLLRLAPNAPQVRPPRPEAEGAEEAEGEDNREDGAQVRFYVACFLLSFVVLFTIFSLILWAASFSDKPKILVKNFYVQAGMNASGVPTDMLTLNSTVKIFYRNPATFFGVHVTSTPLELHYFDLKVVSGHEQMAKFYQSRKSERKVIVVVQGRQVPLYGGMAALDVAKGRVDDISVPLNLSFVIRSRVYILGRLVKPKFYRKVMCEVSLRGNHLGKPLSMIKSDSCVYH